LLTENREPRTENPTVALVGPELYPIPPIRGGAAELFIEQVAARLPRWRPVVIGVSDPDLPLREARDGVQHRRVPLEGWRKRLYCRYRHLFPLYDRAVAGIIEEVRPDLVHVHNRPLLAAFLLNRLGARVPLILHLHNLYHSLGKRERPEPGTPLPVAALVACSRFVLDRERKRLGQGAGLYRVVYNGVDLEAFWARYDHAAEAREVRRHYGLTDEPTVLFAGKLRESKGVHLLLAAMDRVWQAFPRAALVLAGGTEYGRARTMRETPFLKEFRRQVAAARGRVVLTGFVPPPEMPRTYLMGDVFAAPSQIEEGLGLVFLEAAAAGLPVIATRQGGIPEVVRDGETGLLLEAKDDVQELAEKILALLADEPRRRRLGEQGREWVAANFTWEKIAGDLQKLYDEIVEGREI
jgi:spore coat protein SA